MVLCVQSELRPAVCHLRSLLRRCGEYGGLLFADVRMDRSEGSLTSSTYANLRCSVQASDAELRAQLHSVSAYEVEGCYRLLHADYSHSLVHDVLNAIIETAQPPHRVNKATVVATVDHLHPPTIIAQCLHTLAQYSPHSTHNDEHIALCPKRLSQHLAHSIFSSDPPTSHWQQADQLLQRITSSMPAPLTCQPAYLLSIAVSLPSTPSVYRYLPSHSLPVDVRSRLSAMFAVKAKWSGEELSAWMDECSSVAVADSGKADSTWLKHCRLLTEKEASGQKSVMYCSSAHTG